MIKGYEGTLYGKSRMPTFSHVWESAELFLENYKNNGIPTTLDDITINTLYYLLYSRYANSVVASSDVNRFKYNVFAIIWQHGKTWKRRREIQESLQNLTDDQITEGSRQIYNTANNPSVEPGTFSEEELSFINNQNVSKNRKGKLEGYALLWDLLKTDPTEAFLERFKSLFKTVAYPEIPLLYATENTENEEEDDK